MKNFGDLSSHLNTFVHSLFLNWVLAKLGSCSYVEGSVLHLGNLFERRKISVTELPTTVVIQLYRFFTSLKDALSNFIIFQDGLIVEALEFLFYLTIFYLLACEQLTERLGTVSLQVAFSRLLSNIYFPLNTKSILSEALNLLQASFRTADLTESKNFEEVIATYAFCRPLSEKSEADSIRALVRNLQHEESLSESENKIFEKALRSVKDLLMAVSFITNDQFLPIESYDFSSKSFTLHMVNHFPFTDSEIKKSIATLFFLTSNCAVKYFKSSIRNVDLFQSQFTMEVIINLWKSFNFTNKFYQISLRDAHEARTQLQDYQIAMWILIKNETNVLSNFESRLSAIDMIANKEIISGNLSAFIDRISDYLKRLTPPPNFIDPIIKQEIQQAYAIRALQVIEELIEPIQRFLLLTTAHWNCYQMENSVHPLVNTIFRLRAAFLQELESSKRSVESYYRPVYSHFGNLCTELKGFTEMALRWIQESMDGFQFLNSKLKDRPMKKIKFYVAQIETFVSSADSFVKRMLSDFCEFPDILFPYVIVVQSLMVMLSSCQQEMHRHMDYERTQKFLQISRKINFNAEFQKVLFDETFLDMALREDSPMPIHLQEHVVQSIASSNEDSKNILNWLSSKWRFWYEQNTEKREKMFVYKQTGGGTSDEEMVDEDDLETQYLIPDYSSSSFEDIQPSSNDVLKAEQLYKALCLLNDNAISEIGPPDVLSPIIWTLDNFVGTTSTFSKEFLLELKDLHFIEINKLVNNCTPTKQLAKESFNVYFANDPALTLSCLEALQKVEGGVRRLLLEFPENEVLLNILESILKFMALSFEASQMQLAALLEKILEETEHWEKLADRSRSLSEEVNELRYILVEWRKLEVLYWSRILERVQADSEQLSFLISWPLFESLKSIDTAHQTQNLLAALIEWLNSSTYMDFSARLHSGHLLARWAELMKGDFLLAQQIRSILHYFSQYIDVVGEQFKKDKDEIEKELNGFIKVVKYQDLNLWSVKQSVKKAHGHIAKLIKKLKKNGNQTAASLFDIWMPKLSELPSSLSITLSPLVGGSLAMKITDVNKLIHLLVGNMPNYNCFENMSLRCAELLEILESDVKYDGDDEAKQKQQGRALGDRRKRFFHLIKASAEFGLTSRRGQRVKSEELLMNSLMAKSLSLLPNSSGVNNLLLQSSLSRNLVIRFVNKLNSQQSPHVTRQVPVSVMDHIKGISDFGLYWLLNAASAIENFLDRCQHLPLYRDAIDVLIENYQKSSNLLLKASLKISCHNIRH
uniref:Uncharacterized protein n=1 Tax=Acrobeloides nanus TaxID=290746 RepID=A0A914CIH0_9BILA